MAQSAVDALQNQTLHQNILLFGKCWLNEGLQIGSAKSQREQSNNRNNSIIWYLGVRGEVKIARVEIFAQEVEGVPIAVCEVFSTTVNKPWNATILQNSTTRWETLSTHRIKGVVGQIDVPTSIRGTTTFFVFKDPQLVSLHPPPIFHVLTGSS